MPIEPRSPDRHWPYSREAWFALPLALRQRWWRETDFDRREPPAELLAEVAKAVPDGATQDVTARQR
jgi:hypothetical protein